MTAFSERTATTQTLGDQRVITGQAPARHSPEGSGGLYFGCGTIRRYGFGDFQPPGYFCFASSSVTAGRMITSSPCFQFTGVATLCLAVSWIESSTRSTSSKLRPVLIGYVSCSLIFLSGPTTNTERTVALSVAVRGPAALAFGWIMS